MGDSSGAVGEAYILTPQESFLMDRWKEIERVIITGGNTVLPSGKRVPVIVLSRTQATAFTTPPMATPVGRGTPGSGKKKKKSAMKKRWKGKDANN